MKKLTAIVALALLAVAGTGYAVTCAYDNVPGATLLVPYFRVSGAVDASGLIDTSGGTDTKVSFVNVSWPGIIAHVTVWNKYSKAVLDFNVPMTGKDAVSFSMKDILNGSLNVNALTMVKPTADVCGINLTTGHYNATPYVGWGQTNYLRFPHPQSGVQGTNIGSVGQDWQVSISKYATPDAFSAFRAQVMTSLDESGDITSFQSSHGANVLDTDNPACGVGDAVLASITGDFSGYLTIDVVNYCTNWFPNQSEFYENDAIATSGWGLYGYTPNVLIGDVFYVDGTANTGNISGDQAIALEFDTRLNTPNRFNGPPSANQTFFGRFVEYASADICEFDGGNFPPCGAGGYSSPGTGVPDAVPVRRRRAREPRRPLRLPVSFRRHERPPDVDSGLARRRDPGPRRRQHGRPLRLARRHRGRRSGRQGVRLLRHEPPDHLPDVGLRRGELLGADAGQPVRVSAAGAAA